MQSGEVIILATGSIVNFGLNQLDGRGGIAGWRYMFLVQGLISMMIGVVTCEFYSLLPRVSGEVRADYCTCRLKVSVIEADSVGFAIHANMVKDFWMVDFPENAHESIWFLTDEGK